MNHLKIKKEDLPIKRFGRAIKQFETATENEELKKLLGELEYAHLNI